MICGERQLWQAVILRAFEDAIWVDRNPTGPRSEKVSFNGLGCARITATKLRDDAVFWLCLDSRDFQMVCDLAGVQAHKVRAAATRLIGGTPEEKAHWNSRGFSLSELRGDGPPRGRRLRPKGDG